MSRSTTAERPGILLRQWRNRRGVSQLTLGGNAEVSTRHISFVETGRAAPSREMIVQLSEALEIPLRDRNHILEAAGYAPLYRQTPIDDPALQDINQVIDLVLENQHPAGAIAIDWSWNLIKANRSMIAMTAFFADPSLLAEAPINVMRLLFAEGGLHHHVVNWETVGPIIIERIRREAEHAARLDAVRLLEGLLASPSVRSEWVEDPEDVSLPLLIPMQLAKDGVELKLFSTITTLGTPQDITLQELRIEAFYPMDAASRATLHRLCGDPEPS
jgi:transcriptional regulator with XRE-family HTH domain